MACRCCGRIRMARGRPIAAAVVWRAEVRTALEHLAGNPDLRLARIVALVLPPATRVLWNAAGLRRRPRALARTSRSSIPRHCRSYHRGHSHSAEMRWALLNCLDSKPLEPRWILAHTPIMPRKPLETPKRPCPTRQADD